jgi:HK97 family phage major capsid protein
MADMLAELQEKQKKLIADARKLGDEFYVENRWKDAETEKRWKDINGEIDANKAKLAELEKVGAIAARMAELAESEERAHYKPNPKSGRMPGQDDPAVRSGHKPAPPTEEQRAVALGAYLRSQIGGYVSDDEEAAMRACRMSPYQRQLEISLEPHTNTRMRRELQAPFARGNCRGSVAEAESRALSAITYGSGGAMVPDSFVRTLEINMLAFGGIRQAAETITTSGGERMMWPTADDTSNLGEQLGESAPIGNSVDPTFGGVYWDAYKFSSKPILVPFELLEDSAFQLPQILGQMMGERLGRITAQKATLGNGAATMKGIVTCATLGRTTTSATAITYDDLIRLEHSLDPAYRSGAAYMMHDSIVLALRLLKDGNGRYLWQEGIGNSMPDTLNGRPVFISQEMASSIASGNKTILFGQLSRYKIRRVNSIRMYRLEERYRDNDQDGFIALLREDGNLLTAGTSPVVYMTH